MSVTTFGPGALSREKADRLWPGMQYGSTLVFWGLISFKDEHSRDQEMRAFIADRMSLWGQDYARWEDDLCDFWDDIGFEVPRCAYAMLADDDVVEQSERQYIASAMSKAGRKYQPGVYRWIANYGEPRFNPEPEGMRGPCGSVEIAPGVNMLARELGMSARHGIGPWAIWIAHLMHSQRRSSLMRKSTSDRGQRGF